MQSSTSMSLVLSQQRFVPLNSHIQSGPELLFPSLLQFAHMLYTCSLAIYPPLRSLSTLGFPTSSGRSRMILMVGYMENPRASKHTPQNGCGFRIIISGLQSNHLQVPVTWTTKALHSPPKGPLIAALRRKECWIIRFQQYTYKVIGQKAEPEVADGGPTPLAAFLSEPGTTNQQYIGDLISRLGFYHLCSPVAIMLR
jgi:hypothetical protein